MLLKILFSKFVKLYQMIFKMNPTSKRNLVKLGFKITEGNHYKIIYKNDNRYCFTVAKTSSDSRSNQNLRSSILKNLFNTNE